MVGSALPGGNATSCGLVTCYITMCVVDFVVLVYVFEWMEKWIMINRKEE